jgi:hypothetical protein
MWGCDEMVLYFHVFAFGKRRLRTRTWWQSVLRSCFFVAVEITSSNRLPLPVHGWHPYRSTQRRQIACATCFCLVSAEIFFEIVNCSGRVGFHCYKRIQWLGQCLAQARSASKSDMVFRAWTFRNIVFSDIVCNNFRSYRCGGTVPMELKCFLWNFSKFVFCVASMTSFRRRLDCLIHKWLVRMLA